MPEIEILAQLLYSIKVHDHAKIKEIRNILINKKIPHFTYEDISIK